MPLSLFSCSTDVNVGTLFYPKKGPKRDLVADQRSFQWDRGYAHWKRSGPARRFRLQLEVSGPERELSRVYCIQAEHGIQCVASMLSGAGYDVRCLNRICIPADSLFGSRGSFLSTGGNELTYAVFVPCLAYGDATACAGALGALRFMVERTGRRCGITAFINPCSDACWEVFRFSSAIDRVAFAPVSLRRLAGYGAVLDLTSTLFRHGVCLVDSVINELGLDAASIAAEFKVDRLGRLGPVPSKIKRALRAHAAHSRRLLLFVPRASNPVRSMPQTAIQRFIAAAPPGWTIVVVSSIFRTFMNPEAGQNIVFSL